MEDDGTTGDMLNYTFLNILTILLLIPNLLLAPGKISFFWTSWKNSANMELYFDGSMWVNLQTISQMVRQLWTTNL